MILRKHIENDLKRLDGLYSQSLLGADARVPIYYSKLAVLELSGWVEESFDLIAKRAIKGKLKSKKFKDLLDTAISRNYGFDYDSNFLGMLMKVVGLEPCERLHGHLNVSGKHAVLTNELNAMIGQRRKAAHVHLASTTTSFDAPSVSLARMRKLFPILRDMYRWFCH